MSDSFDVGRRPDEFMHAVGGLVVESSILTEAIHVPTRPLRRVSSSCDVETSSGKKRGRGLNDVHVWGHGAHALVVSILTGSRKGPRHPCQRRCCPV